MVTTLVYLWAYYRTFLFRSLRVSMSYFSAPAVPCLQVRSNCLILYEEREPFRGGKIQKQQQRKTYSGIMSPGAKKRMNVALENLVQRTKKRWIYNPCINKNHTFSLAFLTLTLSESHQLTAKETYPLLKAFLRASKRTGLKSYVWKIEIQEKTRDEIHYHIATNNFLRMDYCQHEWNKIQKRAGLLDNYAKKFGNFHPPSTHISGPRNHEKMLSYLVKYISKNNAPNSKLNGKIWDCSEDLNQKLFSDERDSTTEEKLRIYGKKYPDHIIFKDHCIIVKHEFPQKLLSEKCLETYKNWLNPSAPTIFKSNNIIQLPQQLELKPWENVVVPF